MKHKAIDLASEVKRATLPDGLPGFLFPLFEAVSNSLHSTEEKWLDRVEDDGRVDVEISEDASSILVADNGIGFNDRNLSAFLTPLTGHKYERGGKGFGRFITFKVFNEVYYSSPKTDVLTGLSAQFFKYEPFSEDDNLLSIAMSGDVKPHRFESGLTVLMKSPLPGLEDYLSWGSGKYGDEDHRDVIASAIIDHFLLEFIQKKVPKSFRLIVDGLPINLWERFNELLIVGGSKAESLYLGDTERLFTFSYFKVGEKQAKKHRLYFFANNRAASDIENISSGVNDKPFSEMRQGVPEKYYYLVAVSGDFFTSSQSRDRITNLNTKFDFEGRRKSIREHLISLAKQHILEIEAVYTAERRNRMIAEVEHLIAVDPLLRRGLGERSVAEFVRKRSITESREQLAQDLFIERFRKKFDFTKIDKDSSLATLVELVKNQIPADAKEALAVYVAYRNHVIKIFREMLKKHEDGLATEDKVHQLIYPRYKDSEEIDYSSHNLWLIDDDLAYAQYISSDRTPDGTQRAKGQFAHDLLVNNQNELMIVEMKRPQKAGYNATSDIPTNDPVSQIKNQIADIRRKGRVVTSQGREIVIEKTTMVRGYILADWNISLQNYLEGEDFIVTNYGGQMAYRYYKHHNLMLEVVAFDRLVDRASNRNDAFVQILEGRSSYDLKPKGRL